MVIPISASHDEGGHPEFLCDEWVPTEAEMAQMYDHFHPLDVNSSPLSLYNGAVDCSSLAALVNTCKHQQIACELMAERWMRMAEALTALAIQGDNRVRETDSIHTDSAR